MRNASHRFWPCIAAAVAVAVIAVPAASAGVRKYDTHVWLTWEASGRLIHAPARGVESKVRKCEARRRVILFKRRPGAGPDRKLGTTESVWAPQYGDGTGNWGIRVPKGTLDRGDRVYVNVERKVLKDGDVCRGARSETKTWPTEP